MMKSITNSLHPDFAKIIGGMDVVNAISKIRGCHLLKHHGAGNMEGIERDVAKLRARAHMMNFLMTDLLMNYGYGDIDEYEDAPCR